MRKLLVIGILSIMLVVAMMAGCVNQQKVETETPQPTTQPTTKTTSSILELG